MKGTLNPIIDTMIVKFVIQAQDTTISRTMERHTLKDFNNDSNNKYMHTIIKEFIYYT